MEMHQLRYAVAVSRAGTFSRAAQQCHISQPSLSQQILKLEEELGELLFERTKREARATPFGKRFLQRAFTILAEADAVRQEAEDAKSLLSGTLRIGVIPTVAPYLLPPVLTSFLKLFPGVELVIREENTEHLLKALNTHEIDLGLLSPPFDEKRLQIRPILTEELLLALPPEHPLTRKANITPQDLAQERLITLQEGHCLSDQVLGFCSESCSPSRVSFRSAQLETLQALVHAGMGLSLVPAMAIRSDHPNQPVYRSFAGNKPKREVVAAWPKSRSLGRGGSEFLGLLTALEQAL